MPLSQKDVNLYRQQEAAWAHLNDKYDIHTNIIITLDLGTTHSAEVHASLRRPEMVPVDVDYGLVQVGSQFSQYIPFYNPADYPVWTQLMLPDQAVYFFHDDEDASKIVENSSLFQLQSDAYQVVYVPPNSVAQLGPVAFSPVEQLPASTTLLIKNNLTIIATVALRGTGGSGRLLFLRG
jgi:hypothetical protein